jgi:hypothetical protein
MAEVYLELQRHGAYLRCTAIDGDTCEEVVGFGPLREPEALKRLAVQKLRNRQAAKAQAARGGQSGSGTDIKV